jgi:perosamine synthetase
VYVVRLADSYSPEDRTQLRKLLKAKGIQCQTYFRPIHLQPSLQELALEQRPLPMAELIGDRTLSLPFYGDLSQAQVAWICNQIKDAICKLGIRTVPAHKDTRRSRI